MKLGFNSRELIMCTFFRPILSFVSKRRDGSHSKLSALKSVNPRAENIRKMSFEDMHGEKAAQIIVTFVYQYFYVRPFIQT